MPDDADFLCGGWIWDPAPRELRSHTRTRKGWKDEPEQVERLRAVASVTWHRWSQAPMQTATGDVIPASHSRVVVAYEGGGDLTINEANRECAGKLAEAIAAAYGLTGGGEGAPAVPLRPVAPACPRRRGAAAGANVRGEGPVRDVHRVGARRAGGGPGRGGRPPGLRGVGRPRGAGRGRPR